MTEVTVVTTPARSEVIVRKNRAYAVLGAV